MAAKRAAIFGLPLISPHRRCKTGEVVQQTLAVEGIVGAEDVAFPTIRGHLDVLERGGRAVGNGSVRQRQQPGDQPVVDLFPCHAVPLEAQDNGKPAKPVPVELVQSLADRETEVNVGHVQREEDVVRGPGVVQDNAIEDRRHPFDECGQAAAERGEGITVVGVVVTEPSLAARPSPDCVVQVDVRSMAVHHSLDRHLEHLLVVVVLPLPAIGLGEVHLQNLFRFQTQVRARYLSWGKTIVGFQPGWSGRAGRMAGAKRG